MLTYKTGWNNKATWKSDIFSCLLGLRFWISRAFLLIAWSYHKRSNKCNQKNNSKFFHIDSVIIIYKNILFIQKTIFMPKLIIKRSLKPALLFFCQHFYLLIVSIRQLVKMIHENMIIFNTVNYHFYCRERTTFFQVMQKYITRIIFSKTANCLIAKNISKDSGQRRPIW